MNSKTNLVGTKQEDPYSPQLYDLDAVLAMKEAGVNIVGLGYTIYLGSEYEATMMAEARRAHRPGPCQRPHRRAVDLPPRQGRDC